jgi:hypothetical protein
LANQEQRSDGVESFARDLSPTLIPPAPRVFNQAMTVIPTTHRSNTIACAIYTQRDQFSGFVTIQ